MKAYRYHHRYHPLYPLNIYVGVIKKYLKSVRKAMHFFSYAMGIDLILKEVKKIQD